MLLKFPINGIKDRNILVSCTDYENPYVMVRVITFCLFLYKTSNFAAIRVRRM